MPSRQQLPSLLAAGTLAVLTVGLGFSSGGFFPDATAIAAIVLCAFLVVHLTVAAHPLAGLK